MLEIIASLLIGQVSGKFVEGWYYPSGVKEADKYYSTDLPSKKYPLLKLDVTAYDNDLNKIEPGIYSVQYSPQESMILIGTQKVTMKSPIFQMIKLGEKVSIPSASVDFIEDKKVIIIYRAENLEVHSYLYLPEAVLDEK